MKNNYSFVINLAKLDYYKYLENSALLAPIKYILENPGKNLRPSLLLAACDYSFTGIGNNVICNV